MKTCGWCHVEFGPRDGERPSWFQRRRFCSHACSAARQEKTVHGAWSAYSKGCRCVPCRKWNGAKQRRLKDARRAAEVASRRSFLASLTVEDLRRKVVA